MCVTALCRERNLFATFLEPFGAIFVKLVDTVRAGYAFAIVFRGDVAAG